ncbi:MAG: antibiotic biosynthesis monooxygenase [Acidobacteriia bacterium]|nr:antibiotic biosynthesis monooxygenase [Terriglobia bacterium]
MLVLLVQFTVKPGTEDQARHFIHKMQEHSRREPGCRMYVGHQSSRDPRRYFFYEHYDSAEALDLHRASAYYRDYITNGLEKLLENVTRELYQPVD